MSAPTDRSVLTPLIEKAARRIVSIAKPRRIILFGSAVTGKWNADSDLDFLVVVRNTVHRRRMAQEIYRNLRGMGVPIDIIVVTEDDLEQAAEKPGTILGPALKEGEKIYDDGR